MRSEERSKCENNFDPAFSFEKQNFDKKIINNWLFFRSLLRITTFLYLGKRYQLTEKHGWYKIATPISLGVATLIKIFEKFWLGTTITSGVENIH